MTIEKAPNAFDPVVIRNHAEKNGNRKLKIIIPIVSVISLN